MLSFRPCRHGILQDETMSLARILGTGLVVVISSACDRPPEQRGVVSTPGQRIVSTPIKKPLVTPPPSPSEVPASSELPLPSLAAPHARAAPHVKAVSRSEAASPASIAAFGAALPLNSIVREGFPAIPETLATGQTVSGGQFTDTTRAEVSTRATDQHAPSQYRVFAPKTPPAVQGPPTSSVTNIGDG
ncbi:MAG: hypothetical protein QOK44_3983 [Betaproteobacteria bacterium]|jgi:hypothetical protein|nr:hypothetical protein [Betaproteobacteria bacterium]